MNIFGIIGFLVSLLSLFIGGIALRHQILDSQCTKTREKYKIFKDEAHYLSSKLKSCQEGEHRYHSFLIQQKIIEVYILIGEISPLSYLGENEGEQRIIVSAMAERLKNLLCLVSEINEAIKEFGMSNLKQFMTEDLQLKLIKSGYKFSEFKNNLYSFLIQIDTYCKQGELMFAVKQFGEFVNSEKFISDLQTIKDFCSPYFEALSIYDTITDECAPELLSDSR